MKKKFIITEVQAQKILNLSELTQQQQQSTDPCTSWLANQPIFGDIYCCDLFNTQTLTPNLKQKCNDTWNPVGTGWQDCCPGDHNDGPCPNGYSDPNGGYCSECFAGTTNIPAGAPAGTVIGPNNAHDPNMADITGWTCECCKDSRGNVPKKISRGKLPRAPRRIN